ncbi:hypothetical protein ACGGAQ_05675 [Micromonospora sp. NPDC047557]|uniref:hypothetical protein n=1 Tax=Micromonospora sp. NPDC047557 TaxID=3364250 RepID=UPI0037246C34
MTRRLHEVDYATAPRSPWKRPGTIAAAVLLALVVIAGVVVALMGGDDGVPSPAPANPPASQPAGGTSAAAEALPTAIPTTAPRGVTWELVGQAVVPRSATAGPRQVAGGVASGYAHTPEGALIAAAQLSTRSDLYAGRESWEPTITKQFTPGADRDRLLAMYANYDPVPPVEAADLATIGGYRYVSYSPDTAVIAMAMRVPRSSAWVTLTLTVRWMDGDWRMVPPPGGNWQALQAPAPDLSSVVTWGP